MSWLSVADDRVRIVGLTAPEPGTVLVRLRSLTAEPVETVLRPAVRIVVAEQATYLGDGLGDLQVQAGSVLRLEAIG